MYDLKDEYLTGIEQIDQEHRKLFEIAENLYQVLHNDLIHDKFDMIRHLLGELKEYTKFHFSNEETYMESIQYKKIFSQKMEHQKFIQKLEEINLEEVDENQENSIQDILSFLTDWLYHHILELDKPIGLS